MSNPLLNLFTVKEAARLLGVSPGRIRQVCIALKLGRIAASTRFLTAEEIDVIRENQKPAGRPLKNTITTVVVEAVRQ